MNLEKSYFLLIMTEQNQAHRCHKVPHLTGPGQVLSIDFFMSSISIRQATTTGRESFNKSICTTTLD
jgi:hypothetical protein